MAAVAQIIARRPVLAFMLISLGVGFLAAAVPPMVQSEILRPGGGGPADGPVRDFAVRPAAAWRGYVAGRWPCCVPGRGRVVGSRWCRRPRTSQCALAGQGPLVPD